jgi:hypothetical protein
MKKQKENPILVVSGQVVQKNSKINWPDLNYPNSGQTILRTIHNVDYEFLKIQLDGAEGPWFDAYHFPEGVGFYSKIIKSA